MGISEENGWTIRPVRISVKKVFSLVVVTLDFDEKG
jgi:hypothetical protein